MKTTEKLSIGGYVFTLDVDAAAAADAYLNDMSLYYTNPEVTEGIEERMAELLRERVPEGGVVSKADIEGVIAVLGRPERIAEDEPGNDADPVKPARKLYRDKENARVAGVCSGLGAYFHFDPAILRIVFTVLTLCLFFGFAERSGGLAMAAPIAYLILWICIPPARTAQQRWALRGEDPSVEGVRQSVENSSGKVGDALHDLGNSPAWSPISRILEVIMGLFLLVVAVAGLSAGAIAVLGWEWLGLGLGSTLSEALGELTQGYPAASVVSKMLWVKILAALVYALPFIGMLYGSILMLFRIKSPSWHPGLIILLVWLIAVVAFVVLILACVFSPEMLSV